VSCFDHSRTGAAFAAVHLLVRTFPFAGSSVFDPTISQQVTGPDAAILLRLTQQAYQELVPAAGIADGAPIRSEGGWIAGYQVDDTPATSSAAKRQPDDAHTVRVLIRQVGEGGIEGFTEYAVRLVWLNGDWHLVAPDWGDWRAAARAMSAADPSGYRSYDAAGSS
jgi:hypothetical protein